MNIPCRKITQWKLCLLFHYLILLLFSDGYRQTWRKAWALFLLIRDMWLREMYAVETVCSVMILAGGGGGGESDVMGSRHPSHKLICVLYIPSLMCLYLCGSLPGCSKQCGGVCVPGLVTYQPSLWEERLTDSLPPNGGRLNLLLFREIFKPHLKHLPICCPWWPMPGSHRWSMMS